MASKQGCARTEKGQASSSRVYASRKYRKKLSRVCTTSSNSNDGGLSFPRPQQHKNCERSWSAFSNPRRNSPVRFRVDVDSFWSGNAPVAVALTMHDARVFWQVLFRGSWVGSLKDLPGFCTKKRSRSLPDLPQNCNLHGTYQCNFRVPCACSPVSGVFGPN